MVKNKLREIRMKENMLNAKEFCKVIKIKETTYNQIENQKQQGNIETILLISKALNLKVEDIWYLED